MYTYGVKLTDYHMYWSYITIMVDTFILTELNQWAITMVQGGVVETQN